jgi:hypothetical protein
VGALRNERNPPCLAALLVDDDQRAVVLGVELHVGVEKFDPVNGPIGADVDQDVLADAKRLDRAALLLETKVGDVVAWIVRQFLVLRLA